jgi:RodZ C-terminal domain
MEPKADALSSDEVLATLSALTERGRQRHERAQQRRRALLKIGIPTVLVVALAAALASGLVDVPHGARPTLVTTSRAARPATTRAAPVNPYAPATTLDVPALPPGTPVQLTLAAARGASWVEVRAGSNTGKVLYSGTLAAGSREAFTGARLWIRFGGASNVDLAIDGERMQIPAGTYDAVVDDDGFHRIGG